VRYFYRFAPQNLSFVSYRSVSQNDDDDNDNDNQQQRQQQQDDRVVSKSEEGNATFGGNGTEETKNATGKASPTDIAGGQKEDQRLVASNNTTRQSDNETTTTTSTTDEESSSSYPPCWFEDEATGTPLRWQLFVGVLYDLIQMKRFESWLDAKNHVQTRRRRMIPWKIRVHFTSYPSTLLPLTTGGKDDVSHIVFQNYLNSLKQALYIQHQSNKIAKNLNKKSHMILWDGISNNKWDDESTFDEIFFSELNAVASGNSAHDSARLRQIPIRLLVDDEPPFTRPCLFHQSEDVKEAGAACTLEDILKGWLFHLFDRKFCCCIQGIQVPLNIPVDEVWKMLCSPDRFLYIAVVTKFIPEEED
jgi:hypothetical protein